MQVLWSLMTLFLSLGFVHTEPPGICQLQFRFSYSDTGSLEGFCLAVFALVSFGSVYLPVCLSNFGGCGLLLCYFTSLMDQRRIVDSVCLFVQIFICW